MMTYLSVGGVIVGYSLYSGGCHIFIFGILDALKKGKEKRKKRGK